MKNLLRIILLLAVAYSASAQSFNVFDIDDSNFPIMKAKFYAFDADGKQVRNLSPTDFEIMENDELREVLSVSCPPEKPPVAISSVLTIDISGSMDGQGLLNAKAAATSWVNALPLGKSECAITSFNSGNYFNQDFTTDRTRLQKAVNSLNAGGGTDFDAGFINKMSGALIAAENAKYKKVLVFMTDGLASGNEIAIIQKANQMNAVVYCVTLNNSCPPILRNISEQTGGAWFENVTTEIQAKEVYLKILGMAQGDDPCELEWEGEINCNIHRSLEITCLPINKTKNLSYQVDMNNIANLSVNPSGINFGEVIPGNSKDMIITITAKNTSFCISNIKCSNPDYDINPKSFYLKEYESKELTVTYSASDSGYSFCSFEIESTPCQTSFYASGGFPYVSPDTQTLKLTHPVGGEEFLIGSDTIITWEGITPDDTVSLDYSVDEGYSWKNITESATGLNFKWNDIPSPVSDQCLVKVRQIDSEVYTKSLWISKGHKGNVWGVSWSPDGTKIASGSYDCTIKIWDAISGTEIRTLLGHTDKVNSVAWSPDGTRIVSGSSDSTIKIWDAVSGAEIRTYSEQLGFVECVSWSPDGSKIASGIKLTTKIWDAEDGTEIRTLSGHTYFVKSVSWSPDGTNIASGSCDNTIKIWDAASGTEIRTLSGHSSWVESVSWSPDGTNIASGSSDSTIKIWDAASGMELRTFLEHTGKVYGVSWNPDGKRIASGSQDQTIKIWDAESGTEIRTLSGYAFSVHWSPDGSKIASGSVLEINLWDAEIGTKIRSLSGHKSTVFSVSWSPDGSKIASGSQDNTIKIWDAVSGTEIRTIASYARSVSWSPDGTRIASGGSYADPQIKIWNVASGTDIRTLSGHTHFVYSISWSPDGTKIASGSEDETIKIWGAETGEELRTLSGHTERVNSVSWSPDGTRIVSGSKDHTIKIWDVESGTEIKSFPPNNRHVFSVSWSPDGTRIASGSQDEIVKIWDAETGTEIRTLPTGAYCLSWSPDGTRIASGRGGDNSIKIWNAERGTKIITLPNNHSANSVSWSPDGTRISSGSGDTKVTVWSLNPSTLQTDISDSLFSIVAPSAESKDIYMGIVVKNTMKDSVITDFIKSKGSWPCRIDSIYFQGTDAPAFMLVGGIPQYTVEEGKDHFGEFRFMPSEAKYYAADIVIITQSDTLYQTISGDGVNPMIAAFPDILDFGIVETMDESVLTKNLIKNVSNQDIKIDSTVMLGPDYEQFHIDAGGGSFTLAPDEERELTVRFAPKYIGRTSGQIGFYFENDGSPAIAQLFGKGIGGNLRMLNDSAYSGDRVTLKIVMDGIDMNKFASVIGSYDITFSVDKTTLAPTESIFFESIQNDRAIINYSGTVENNQEYIAAIEFAVGLGQYEVSDIYVEDVIWYDHDGNIVEFDTEFTAGTFTLLGICREGGDRLIMPTEQAGMTTISPNPAGKKLNIEYALSEIGYTEISIYNTLGEKVTTVFAENVSDPHSGELSSDISELASGQYLIIYKTGAFLQSEIFVVLK